jgi:polyisoprenoid-binding protein YceI
MSATTITPDRIDTGEENRDGHLKWPEFFDVERNPTISFHSTATEATADGQVKPSGEITITGLTPAA